jgi:hypothetical protein
VAVIAVIDFAGGYCSGLDNTGGGGVSAALADIDNVNMAKAHNKVVEITAPTLINLVLTLIILFINSLAPNS